MLHSGIVMLLATMSLALVVRKSMPVDLAFFRKLQFGNVCAPHGAVGTCNDLVKCLHAISDESKKAQRKEQVQLGYFEVDEIMAVAMYTWTWALLQKAEIPAKCAALYEKHLR